jgi:FixJ family two-component response regulator
VRAWFERPIVFLAGGGDIPMSVRAMRAGAVNFLTKPVARPELDSIMRRLEHPHPARERGPFDRSYLVGSTSKSLGTWAQLRKRSRHRAG